MLHNQPELLASKSIRPTLFQSLDPPLLAAYTAFERVELPAGEKVRSQRNKQDTAAWAIDLRKISHQGLQYLKNTRQNPYNLSSYLQIRVMDYPPLEFWLSTHKPYKRPSKKGSCLVEDLMGSFCSIEGLFEQELSFEKGEILSLGFQI